MRSVKTVDSQPPEVYSPSSLKTKEELVERIYKYFEEINESPVVYHWKYRLDEIDPSEELHVETLPLKKSS